MRKPKIILIFKYIKGGETALMRAIQFKQRDVIEFLIQLPSINLSLQNKVIFV